MLTSKCDLELWHRVMGRVCNTPTYHSEHYYRVLWRYNNNLWPGESINYRILTFDVSVWPWTLTKNMDLVHDTSTCQSKHFYQVLWYNKNWPLSLTSTFNLESWMLYAATRLHIKVNISTKYYEDTLINCEVMARTMYKLQKCLPLISMHDLDLWHRVMGLVRDTPTQPAKHFYQVIWKYNNNLRSYSPGNVGWTDGPDGYVTVINVTFLCRHNL